MSEKTAWATAQDFLKNHWRRLLLSAFLLIVFFGNSGFRSLVRNYLELRRLRLEILSLEREEHLTQGRLAEARSGTQATERLARRELGYIKTGEVEYRFTPPASQDR